MRAGKTLLLCGTCTLILSSCSWLQDWPPGSSSSASSSSTVSDIRVVSQGASGMGGQVRSEMDGAVTTPIGHDLRVPPVAMRAPVGAEVSQDQQVAHRIEKLEEELAALHETLDKMMPAITRLANADRDLEKKLAEVAPAAGALSAAAVSRPVRAKPAAVRQVSYPTTDKLVVHNMRIGEHPDKTRLVMDVSSSVPFNYELDNDGLILLIELPKAAWQAGMVRTSPRSPVLESVTSQDDGKGGTRVAIQLRQPVRVVMANELSPVSGKPYRLVMDLAAL